MRSILLGSTRATVPTDGNPAENPVVAGSLRASLLHVEYHQPLAGTRLHVQPGVEVHFTVAGRGVLRVGGRAHAQSPGTGVVLRGPEPHRLATEPTPGFQRNVVCFAPADYTAAAGGADLLKTDWLPERGGFGFRLAEHDATRADALVRSLRFETGVQPHGWRGMALGALLQLLGLISRHGVEARAVPAGARSGRGALVEQACAQVRANLADDLSLTGTAARLGVSAEHLTRTFRRQLGLTFHRYVLAERVNAARDLLRCGRSGSVTEAGFAAGFQSSAHFSRVFKAHTGLTPSGWRDAQV